MNNKRLRIIYLSISIILFITSLTQHSYCSLDDCGDAMAAFIFGAIGFVMGGAAITWPANPLLIVSWLTFKRRPRVALGCSILASGLAFSFLLFDKIIADEAGNYEVITGYAAGYWLWVASITVMLIGISYLLLNQHFNQKQAYLPFL